LGGVPYMSNLALAQSPTFIFYRAEKAEPGVYKS
jgi:hypothetical protein